MDFYAFESFDEFGFGEVELILNILYYTNRIVFGLIADGAEVLLLTTDYVLIKTSVFGYSGSACGSLSCS
jgi:hypothetical protein